MNDGAGVNVAAGESVAVGVTVRVAVSVGEAVGVEVEVTKLCTLPSPGSSGSVGAGVTKNVASMGDAGGDISSAAAVTVSGASNIGSPLGIARLVGPGALPNVKV